jgi:hypothetical protein
MRRTAKKQVTYRVGEETYSADTLTQAKEKAKEHAEYLLSGNWSPRFLSWRGHDIIMWRGRYGWEYRIVYPDQRAEGKCYSEGSLGFLWGNGFNEEDGKSEEKAWARACHHLAQVTWEHADGADDSSFPAWVTDEKERESLVGWAKFQVQYTALRAEGYTDTQAHAMACGWSVDASGRTVPQSARVAV